MEPAVGLGCILEEDNHTFREHLAVFFHRNTQAAPKGSGKRNGGHIFLLF